VGRVERPEQLGGGLDLVSRQVRLEHQVERRPELAAHLLRRELDAQLRAERVQGRDEAVHGVDQGHVEVEPDHQRLHPVRVRRGPDGPSLALVGSPGPTY